MRGWLAEPGRIVVVSSLGFNVHVIATSSHSALSSGTRHEKHAAHVAAAALSCTPFEGMSGVSVVPVADSPYFRPVVGLISASTACTTACEMTGIEVNTVKISEPMEPDSWKHDCSTALTDTTRGQCLKGRENLSVLSLFCTRC